MQWQAKDKGTKNDLQNTTQKLKTDENKSH